MGCLVVLVKLLKLPTASVVPNCRPSTRSPLYCTLPLLEDRVTVVRKRTCITYEYTKYACQSVYSVVSVPDPKSSSFSLGPRPKVK